MKVSPLNSILIINVLMITIICHQNLFLSQFHAKCEFMCGLNNQIILSSSSLNLKKPPTATNKSRDKGEHLKYKPT